MPEDIATPFVESSTKRRNIFLLSLAAVAFAALPGRAQTEKNPFTPAELDQMLAPMRALFRRAVVAGSHGGEPHPPEIVEACALVAGQSTSRAMPRSAPWATRAGMSAWKSLVAFPPVLAQLNEHLEWTQKLGDALIGQQQDVAASIQRLRAKAAEAGTLKTGKEQTVTSETQGSETVYAIQPTNPEVVYVPTYDPNTAYGQWSDPAYPPTYYPFGGALLTGLTWGLGFAAAGAMFGGWNWGNSGGGGNYVNINANRATNIDRNFNRNNIGDGGRWQHQVDHRKGVAYRDNATRQQFGQNRPGADQRQQFRGQLDQGARPGGGPGGGQRPGGAGPGGAGPGGGRPGGAGPGGGGPGGGRPGGAGPGGAGPGGGRPGGGGNVGQARPGAQPRPGGGQDWAASIAAAR